MITRSTKLRNSRRKWYALLSIAAALIAYSYLLLMQIRLGANLSLFGGYTQQLNRPLIVEILPFNHELDLLERRLNYSYPDVDLFVIVEAIQTYTGQRKNLTFQLNQDRFDPYKDKIRHFADTGWVEPDMTKMVSSGHNYYYIQKIKRSFHKKAVMSLGLRDDDLVWYCDVDEFIDHNSPELVLFLETTWDDRKKPAVVYNAQQEYFYDFHCQRWDRWHRSYFTTYSHLKRKAFDLHNQKFYCDKKDAVWVQTGWHLTYFMTLDGIRHKMRSNSDYVKQVYSEKGVGIINNDDSYFLRLVRECLYVDERKFTKTNVANVTYRPPGFDEWEKEYRAGNLYWQQNYSGWKWLSESRI